jgi:hypothetical protein
MKAIFNKQMIGPAVFFFAGLLISFFNLVLKSRPIEQIDGPSKYPEVINLH